MRWPHRAAGVQIRYLQEGARVHQTELDWQRLKMQHQHDQVLTGVEQKHQAHERDMKHAMDHLTCDPFPIM